MKRRTALRLSAMIATSLAWPAAWAQLPPQVLPRTIRLVVPYPPGGPLDIVARWTSSPARWPSA